MDQHTVRDSGFVMDNYSQNNPSSLRSRPPVDDTKFFAGYLPEHDLCLIGTSTKMIAIGIILADMPAMHFAAFGVADCAKNTPHVCHGDIVFGDGNDHLLGGAFW